MAQRLNSGRPRLTTVHENFGTELLSLRDGTLWVQTREDREH
jgi:hypothetical protein